MKFTKLHLRDQGAQVDIDITNTVSADIYDIAEYGSVGLKITARRPKHDGSRPTAIIPWGHIRSAECENEQPAAKK